MHSLQPYKWEKMKQIIARLQTGNYFVSLFKSSPANLTKPANLSSVKAKNSPGAGQEKSNNEKRSAENEELNAEVAKKSKTAPK